MITLPVGLSATTTSFLGLCLRDLPSGPNQEDRSTLKERISDHDDIEQEQLT